jgi:hypothetical protein
MRDLKGMVIAEDTVSYAVFVYTIINFANLCVLLWMADKRMDADSDAVVDGSRLRHHFR